MLGGAQLAVGAAAIFARFALEGAKPLAVAAARLCIAAVVLLAIAAIRKAPASPIMRPSRRLAILLVLAGFALAVHFATWIASLEYTTVAVSTLLVASTPIWTAIYDAVVCRRGLSPASITAFITGGAGLLAVVGFNRTAPPIAGHALLGALLAIVGSLGMAAYLIVVRNARKTLDTQTIVTRTYAWSALFLIGATAIGHQTPPHLDDISAWGGILGMALISQLLGHTAINASLRWFSPSAVSFTNLIEPVAAAALALLIFGEMLSPVAIAGAAILLASVAVVLREERSLEISA
ncbi:MAG: EamA family transporter [Candidatus Eremiobacteraeota bacterium]|nr:EamA family transporter [Candidatus Eremiobacteraeota bacterium]